MSDQAPVASAPAAAPVSTAPAVDTSTQSQAPQTQSGVPSPADTQALEAAAKNGTPVQKAEAKKMLKELKLNVYGKEYTEQLPFEIPEEHAEYFRNELQKSRASQKSFQEKSQLESQVKDFVAALKGNTKATLQQMGIDPKAFAAAVLEEELKLQQMSPEQRKQQELEAKIKELEDRDKKQKDEFNKKEFERQTQIEYEKIDTQMTKALESTDLPKTPYSVKRLAHYMQLGLNNGLSLSVDELVPIVRAEIQSEMQELINALGEDKAENFIGKDILNKIRKKNISKAKVTPGAAKAAIKDVGNAKPASKSGEKVDFKKYFGI